MCYTLILAVRDMILTRVSCSWGLQIAVASGATVISTSSSDEKLKVAKKLGATHLINYKTTPDWDDEVLKLTGGRGADHILEACVMSVICEEATRSQSYLTGWWPGNAGQIFEIGEIRWPYPYYRFVRIF